MQITVYTNFSKRVNSTKRPTSGTGTAVDVVLKDECTIISPTFILNKLDFDINYVEAFGNYYFAHVKNLDGHRSEIICTIDHLATFKTQIGSYSGFVEYAASAPDSYIYLPDPRNGASAAMKYGSAEEDPGWVVTSQGCYILAVNGILSNGMGGSPAYYVCTPTELNNIVAEIFDQSLASQVEKQFNGVANSIVSCVWLPFSAGWVITQTGAVSSQVCIGSELLNSTAHLITSRVWHVRKYASIPNPLGYSGTYIQTSQYYLVSIFLPGVGVCPVNYDMFKDNALGSITIDIELDFLTGDIVYNLSNSSPNGSEIVAVFSGNVETKVPVAGASYDGIGVAGGIVETLGNAMKGSISGVASGVFDVIQSLECKTMIVGANSSCLGPLYKNKIEVEVYVRVPIIGSLSDSELYQYRAEQGMPYMKTVTISSLSGYVKCSAASVNIPGDGEEQKAVNDYLNSGFYYE